MSQIRGKNTKIDLKMVNILKRTRLKFKMYPKMYGNPDFAHERLRIAVFCDGDFWHGYRYHEKKKPSKKFWRDKIEGNMKRDMRYTRKLRSDGWSVIRIWEHDIEKNPEKCLNRIRRVVQIRKLGK